MGRRTARHLDIDYSALPALAKVVRKAVRLGRAYAKQAGAPSICPPCSLKKIRAWRLPKAVSHA